MPIYAFLVAGIASWFDPSDSVPAIRPATSYVCASNMVPPGTQLSIVNDDNGRYSHCTVTGTGPFIVGRILDVSPAVRDELGFDGLTTVRVYRVVGHYPHCHREPQPQSCEVPCVLDLPKPALLRCP